MNAEVKIDLERQIVIGAVPATMIEIIWDQVEPLIQRVIDKAPEDLSMKKIKNDKMFAPTMYRITSIVNRCLRRETTRLSPNAPLAFVPAFSR